MTRKYTNDEITVIWKPGLCIHSANCVNGLPGVFDVKKTPWINMEGADAQTITEQVSKCPSGALSIEGSEAKPQLTLSPESIVAGSTPLVLELEEGKTYAWCACGRSKNQPWCDGSHSITSIKPVVFKSSGTAKKAMCMCKQSSTQPFCDGTHNKL
jgi:uncharacterized Fe-S cluster protein YjdI/CDGSH-type Zn-finger protein